MNEQNETTEAKKKGIQAGNWKAWKSLPLKSKKKVIAILGLDSILGKTGPDKWSEKAKEISKTLTRPADPKTNRKAVTVEPNFVIDVLTRWSGLYYNDPTAMTVAVW